MKTPSPLYQAAHAAKAAQVGKFTRILPVMRFCERSLRRPAAAAVRLKYPLSQLIFTIQVQVKGELFAGQLGIWEFWWRLLARKLVKKLRRKGWG